MEKCIEVEQLQVGMYVVRLDRPWLDTPFPTQGFPVTSKRVIDNIAQYCDEVYINTDEGIDVGAQDDAHERNASVPSRVRTVKEIRNVIENGQLPKLAVKYARRSSFVEEAKVTQIVYKETRAVVDDIHERAKNNEPIDAEQPKALIQELVTSVIRNPDASSWLSNLKNQDTYTADHSMNVCMISLVFGRHLGLKEEPLNELGLGALLHDIGKIRTPSEVLNKPGKLTDKEMNVMRYHTIMGRDLLMKSPGISDTVIDIAYSHHERMTGGGYPRGIFGDRISLFAKMVAIVDVYDAITSDRVYHKGMSSADALHNIYKWRGKHFDPYLAEQFIQCIGTFPVGSIVELSSGEIGIVVGFEQKRRLLPQVMMVRDAELNLYQPIKYVDLAKLNDAGTKLTVSKTLPAGEHGIRVQDFIFNTAA